MIEKERTEWEGNGKKKIPYEIPIYFFLMANWNIDYTYF